MTILGTHLVADLYGCRHLDDPVAIEAALRAAVTAAGATLIDIRLHHFGGHQGVTGVALLAESHMSIHTWPEHDLAAIDVFLCGPGQQVDIALQTISQALAAKRTVAHRIARGVSSLTAGPG
jgi:S-adenosylmethionine decarboxylase